MGRQHRNPEGRALGELESQTRREEINAVLLRFGSPGPVFPLIDDDKRGSASARTGTSTNLKSTDRHLPPGGQLDEHRAALLNAPRQLYRPAPLALSSTQDWPPQLRAPRGSHGLRDRADLGRTGREVVCEKTTNGRYFTIHGIGCSTAATTMSTPDRDDGDVPIGVDPSDLASHAPVANQQPGTVCRWRTARYHDQECARYFDCPSHHVERALSDNEQELEEDREEHLEEGVEPEGDEDRPDSGAVSPLSDDGGEHESHQRARSPSPVLPSAATAATDPRSRAGESEGQHGLAGMSDRNPIMVTDSSSDSDPPGAERGSGAPLYPVPGPQVNTRPVPVAGPPPMTLVQGPAPTVMERSRGSEVRMPRWQPDSEVTYCPICSTQFSIWVRKHHCR